MTDLIQHKTSRILGAAFILQFAASLFSGTILRKIWLVPGNISGSMINIADNAWIFRTNILVDMITALGIILLGTMLYLALRKQNEKIALTALFFYIIEAALLAVSRMEAFSLLQISREYVNTGHPADLLMMGNIALASMDFAGSTLHMLVFCPGGILFYYLLFKSGLVPRALSLWGLITVIPCLIGTLIVLFGYQISFYIYLPYVPFELIIGIWILIKGIKQTEMSQISNKE
jgi:hypothetical protein